MKLMSISVLFIGLGMFHGSAYADEFACSNDDGYCHRYVATEGDTGPTDDSFCGETKTKISSVDQSCHLYSPCGADEGKVASGC